MKEKKKNAQQSHKMHCNRLFMLSTEIYCIFGTLHKTEIPSILENIPFIQFGNGCQKSIALLLIHVKSSNSFRYFMWLNRIVDVRFLTHKDGINCNRKGKRNYLPLCKMCGIVLVHQFRNDENVIWMQILVLFFSSSNNMDLIQTIMNSLKSHLIYFQKS